jgi:hypothetical protein
MEPSPLEAKASRERVELLSGISDQVCEEHSRAGRQHHAIRYRFRRAFALSQTAYCDQVIADAT